MAEDKCKGASCPEDCPAHSGMEVSLKHTEKFIEEMRTNHLPHIQSRLDGINKWLIGVLVSVILLLMSLLVRV